MPQHAIELLDELDQGRSDLTTGVGQHQMGRDNITSSSTAHVPDLGRVSRDGLRYPAALGAKAACPDKEVIDIERWLF